MAVKHFLTLLDIPSADLLSIIDRASELKVMQHSGKIFEPLKNQVLAMVFEKSSTRTRVSFEAGMAQFGGHAIFMSPNDTQLGRGEPIEDTARVLSGMVDAIMIRTFAHEKLEQLAKYASVPVINGLTDTYHPCQLLADVQTYQEHRGPVSGRTVTWIGDGNNMCHSYINAARQFDFKLNICHPQGYAPDAGIVSAGGSHVEIFDSPEDAVRNVDAVATDVWASMGQEDEAGERCKVFAPYQVNAELMALAASDVLFLHCLPAHRGEEVTADVIDASGTVVWDEAGNRLHAQKALLEYLMVS